MDTSPPSMNPIQYDGPPDAVCPITLIQLSNLERPVTFRAYTQQPYECESLVRWLSVRKTNPLTRERVEWDQTPLEAIAPIDQHSCYKSTMEYIELKLGL